MSYLRAKHGSVMFLVVSDDPDWCRRELRGPDIVVVAGNSGAVDLAIMSICQAAIVDYGTFSVWGGILCGGEVVIRELTTHFSLMVY